MDFSTSNRSPRANAIALLVVGIVAVIGGGMFENPVVLIVGLVALVGASFYLATATTRDRETDG